MSPGILHAVWLTFAGCGSDYGLGDMVPTAGEQTDVWAEPVEVYPEVGPVGEADDELHASETPVEGDVIIDVRLDAGFQRLRWGHETARCTVQASFHLTSEDFTGAVGIEEEETEEPEGVHCEFGDEPVGDNSGSGYGDGWLLSGELAGPEEIYLFDEQEQPLVLELVEVGDGQLRYELVDCDEETFPFGQALDLDVPENDGAVPGFHIGEAIVVGAGLDYLWPAAEDTDHNRRFHLGEGQDFPLEWTFLHPTPTMGEGTEAPPQVTVRMQSGPHQEEQADEFLACTSSEEDGLTIPADVLANFSFNPDPEVETYDTSLDIHAVTDGPRWTSPWGQSVRVTSTITAGGAVFLAPGE